MESNRVPAKEDKQGRGNPNQPQCGAPNLPHTPLAVPGSPQGSQLLHSWKGKSRSHRHCQREQDPLAQHRVGGRWNLLGLGLWPPIGDGGQCRNSTRVASAEGHH